MKMPRLAATGGQTARMLVALCAMLCINSPGTAQIRSWGVDEFHAPPDPRWGEITRTDVEAAYKLLRDNHPGGAAELHDLAFQGRLNSAHGLALERARTVVSYQGYAAVLAGFASGMGDKHIWSRPTFVVNVPRWAGIIPSKRGKDWIVTDTDESRAALRGASLISCNGEDIDELARKNLGGFRVDWNVGAQQVQSAPWLLIDEGNPFITRPSLCLFEQAGKRQSQKLDWMRIKRESLLPRLQAAIGAGAAGYGVRRVDGGYWISLQSLQDERTAGVVKEVEDQKAALRAAPFVVLDLRGNGGGSSLYGRQMAVSLFGREFVDATLGPEGGRNVRRRRRLARIRRQHPQSGVSGAFRGCAYAARGEDHRRGAATQDAGGARSRSSIFRRHQLPRGPAAGSSRGTPALLAERAISAVDRQPVFQFVFTGDRGLSQARCISHRTNYRCGNTLYWKYAKNTCRPDIPCSPRCKPLSRAARIRSVRSSRIWSTTVTLPIRMPWRHGWLRPPSPRHKNSTPPQEAPALLTR